MRRIPFLEKLLGSPVVPGHFGRFFRPVTAVAGWGRKPTSLSARRYAEKYGLPYLAVEDGFLRSLGLGSQEPPLSVVVDDLGIYYDATRPSRLEALIPRSLSDDESVRTHELIAAWRAGRVSKYNPLREYVGDLPQRYVLVVDQTYGDAAIECGLAGADSFQRMLQAALDEHPNCTVLVKVHPDVFAGKKRGYFDVAALSAMPRVQVLAVDAHPVRLLESALAVYVVTSQMGFEALLWGRPVRTFGMPFYAGWGLTQDALDAPSRRKSVTLAQLMHAALVAYPRYVDPETGERCEVEMVLAHIALQRRMRSRYPAIVYASGFSPYKKPIVRDYLQGSEVRFVPRPQDVLPGGVLALWGRQAPVGRDVRLLQLEDGFLRSVGLGADLIRPVSWVMDGRGMYFDATTPSDLEVLLQNEVFDEALCARARRLRERIVAAGLTKYNVGATHWQRPGDAGKVILVPGQVETDASIAYGAPGIHRNIDLLRTVREANPNAYVLYKPHPDVLAKLRAQGLGEAEALRWCDEVVADVAMGELLPQVDAVHALTSLAGFEALLRGKAVTCYGQPFYAGWGLTTDVVPVARRTRQLTMDELVAGSLICYPVYLSRVTNRYTSPERALEDLLVWRDRGGGLMWWSPFYRWFRSTFVKGR
jgi:capsular polysaccharide export protein